jgi:carbon storage regulator
MLVVTRKAGDKILIGDNITITLLSCDGGRLRIGIDAPREVRVLRAELLAGQKAVGPTGQSAGIEPTKVP